MWTRRLRPRGDKHWQALGLLPLFACNLGLLESRRTLGESGLGKARALLGKAGQEGSRLAYPQAVSRILTTPGESPPPRLHLEQLQVPGLLSSCWACCPEALGVGWLEGGVSWAGTSGWGWTSCERIGQPLRHFRDDSV